MLLLAGLLLSLACVAVVALPLLRARLQQRREEALSALEGVVARKEAIYEEMRTLALELDLGHITEEEFRARLSPLRVRAAQLLRQQEALEARAGLASQPPGQGEGAGQ